MKNNSSTDRVRPESKAKPQGPKLEGGIALIAKKGRMLPLRYVGPGLVQITDKKHVALDWGSLPYESKIMVRRALKAGDVMLKGDK